MEDIRSIYRKVTLLLVAGLFVIILSTYIYFIQNTADIYEKQAVESIVDVKKDFLKSTINNLVLEIDLIKEKEQEFYKKWILNISHRLGNYYQSNPERFIDLFMELCDLEGNKDIVSVSIEDTISGQIVYERGVFIGNNPTREDFAAYYTDDYDHYKISFGVSNDHIEQSIKRLIVDAVHSKEFSQNPYIWINEIKDDIGDHPYLAELEGLKNGEDIFLNYNFQKEDNDVKSEMLIYARLYEKYDWVIATGVHLDEIVEYIATSGNQQKKIVIKTIINTLVFMLIIFVFYWGIVSKVEIWYYKKYNKNIKEVFVDPLTEAKNRRSATMFLETAFKEFKRSGHTPMIMMIDIDDFKKVNDTYGHHEGDLVLQNVVESIKNNIKKTDTVYRWGGEEFLLVCNGLKEDDVIAFSNKIITAVAKKKYNFNGDNYHMTISMGIDRFDKLDMTYEEAVKRADLAMYSAKSKGKNRACTWAMCGNNPLQD